jgi:hypothetical protein
MKSLLASLPAILPIAHAWGEKQEALILETGILLDKAQLSDAYRAGVLYPEKIRLLKVDILPPIDNEDVMFLAKQIGFYSANSWGLTFGYGICLRHDFWSDRYSLTHECVHVAQYERLKVVRPFLNEYLRECLDPGYPFGSLEQEAIRVARDICKPKASADGSAVH